MSKQVKCPSGCNKEFISKITYRDIPAYACGSCGMIVDWAVD